MQFFFDQLYENRSKIDQDRHILQFIEVGEPRRRRPRFKNRSEKTRLVMSYFVYNQKGDKFKVCARSFESICCISRSRMNRICKRFYLTHEMPIERRGGHSKSNHKINSSIIDHISSSYIELRNGDVDVFVRKMWKLWTDDRTNRGLAVAPYSQYLSLFKQYTSTSNWLDEDVRSDMMCESLEYNGAPSVKLQSEFADENEVTDKIFDDIVPEMTLSPENIFEIPESLYSIPESVSQSKTAFAISSASNDVPEMISATVMIPEIFLVDSESKSKIDAKTSETANPTSRVTSVNKTRRNSNLFRGPRISAKYPKRTIFKSRTLVKKSRKQLQTERHSSANKTPTIECEHYGRNQTCQAKYLTADDMCWFFDRLYQHKTKIEQDCHLLQFIEIEKPRRHRPRPGSKRKVKARLVLSHFVDTVAGDRLKVCARSFETISCISRSRLTRLCRKFFLTRTVPVELRGRRGVRRLNNEVIEGIEDDIRSYESKNESRRTVMRMWQCWKDRRNEKGLDIASYHTYRNIFKKLNDFSNLRKYVELDMKVIKTEPLNDTQDTEAFEG